MKYFYIISWIIVSIGWGLADYTNDPVALMFLTVLWMGLTLFNVAMYWPEEKEKPKEVSKGAKWSREDD